VAVRVLVVRFGPSQEWSAIGGLDYGDEVYPIARSANGNWIAIDWEGETGWLLAQLVNWGFDIQTLPVLLPPYTSTPLSNVGTDTPEAEIVEETLDTPSPVPPSRTPSETAKPDTSTPSPEETAGEAAEEAAESTPEGEVIILASSTPTPTNTTEAPPVQSPTGSAVQVPNIGIFAGGGAAMLLVVLYVWFWAAGRRSRNRYVDGFPLEVCPVCQTGKLHMEEHASHLLGIPQVRRLVRCNNCRSVLREVRSGTWRYTIDPFVNEKLAEEHNGQLFTDADLLVFAEQAGQYEPYNYPVVPPE
jgi:uncharacterized protein YraI